MIKIFETLDIRYIDGFWYTDENGGFHIVPLQIKQSDLGMPVITSQPNDVMVGILNRIHEKSYIPNPEQIFLLGLKIVPMEKRNWESGQGYYYVTQEDDSAERIT